MRTYLAFLVLLVVTGSSVYAQEINIG
ncbi:MAG: hypothetical protein ACI8VZ_002084, partial [Candidatus Paceibacteria bacterium]